MPTTRARSSSSWHPNCAEASGLARLARRRRHLNAKKNAPEGAFFVLPIGPEGLISKVPITWRLPKRERQRREPKRQQREQRREPEQQREQRLRASCHRRPGQQQRSARPERETFSFGFSLKGDRTISGNCQAIPDANLKALELLQDQSGIIPIKMSICHGPHLFSACHRHRPRAASPLATRPPPPLARRCSVGRRRGRSGAARRPAGATAGHRDRPPQSPRR